VRFIPWKGENYETGFAGRHVLVLGESHYCASAEDVKPEMTCEIIRDLFNPDSESEPYKNTYTKFAKAMLGRETLTFADKKTFWNSVAFYNFVQTAMTGPRLAPSTDDFKCSEGAFFEVMETLRPDLIIVWGSRLYNNLPRGGMQGPDLRAPDGKWIETWKYFLKDGSDVPVLPIMHPSAAFSPEYWNQVIGLAL